MSGSKTRTFQLSVKKRAVLESLLRKEGVVSPTAGRITRRTAAGPAVLSFSQQRVWFIDQFEPGNSVYNIHAALDLKGHLSVPALEGTLNEILRRHESLRTRFVVIDDEPVQIIDGLHWRKLEVIELQGGMEPGAQENEGKRLSDEEAREPFDLTKGNVLRIKLVRFGSRRHRLFVTVHHIISDGWSFGILVREVATLYEAYSSGRPSPLAELTIQYADFAVWQREWLDGAVFEEQLNYWKKRLASIPATLELPADRARPKIQTFRTRNERFRLPKTLSERLANLSTKGMTLFMTLLAGFDLLLCRYSGQEDILVGSPIANRNHAEIEGLIGFFVNTLVLRTDMSGEPTFKNLVARVRETALGAYAHQDLPFDKLVEELRPPRSAGQSPLFQVMFVLQNTPREELVLPGLTLSQLDVASPGIEFDLTLAVKEVDGELKGAIGYNSDLFDATTIHRMIGHFVILLAAAAADPDRRISEFPMLTTAERHQLSIENNQTDRIYRKDISLHDLFDTGVTLNPDGIAIAFDDKAITFDRLYNAANQLAGFLSHRDAGPESLIGVCLERSSEMIVAILGVLKSGAAYVPLDPEYPSQRLSYIVRDAGIKLVLTTQQSATGLPDEVERVMVDDWHQIFHREGSYSGAVVDVSNAAYVIYTSGSTGVPKGVLIPHTAICNRLQWGQEELPLTSSDVMLQQSSPSFDVSIWEIFSALIAGARVVIARPGETNDVTYLAQLISECRVTVAGFVPSLLKSLVAESTGRDLSCLRQVLSGAEPLNREVENEFQARLDASLYNFYGPTEGTIDTAYYHCGTAGVDTVPIGRPIGNVRVYVLDLGLEPVPLGVVGELYASGSGLSRGYLARPDLTAERFICDPFSTAPGARIYRTGDLARVLPEGVIEFGGRADYQVKVRGRRIELGEIEAALVGHQSVQAAAAAPFEGGSGDTRLAAYVTVRQGQHISTSELREFLGSKLPEYMVPAVIIELDSLPLLPNGKINRKLLPPPSRSKIATGRVYVAPRNAVEEVLADIFSDVLKVDRVGIFDDFFELGGHSLIATQAASRIRGIFQIELPLRKFFESPTIAQLSERIAAAGADAARLEKMARMKKEIDKLSAQEIEGLLKERNVKK